jgi:hypothetical protein
MKRGTASRALSWAVSLLFAAVLSACGGGGDANPAAGPAPTAAPNATTNPGDAANVDALVVSAAYLDLMVLTQSNAYQQRNLSVHVGYVGDGVLVGYAPGVTPASWLTFSGAVQSAGPDSQFDLPISLTPTGINEGFYKTTLRFVSGYADGRVNGIVDVPIYLSVQAAPPVYAGDLVVGGYLGKLAGLARSLPLDFGGMVPDRVTPVLRSEMGAPDQWLSTEWDAQKSQLTARVQPALKVGKYEGYIDVKYTIHGAPGLRSIPFRIVVQADAPSAERVAPSYVYALGSSTLVVRGHGLRKASAAVVKLGSVAASQVTIVSDSEIRAVFNSPAPEGQYALQVVLDGKATALGDVAVIARPTYTRQDILPPCSTESGDVIYDPRRGNLIGFCDDTYYVMAPRGSVWSTVATRKLDGIGYGSWFYSKALLTPDQKYLVVSGPAKLTLLDPATLQTIETRPIPAFWPDSAGYGYLSLEAALNNGKIILNVSGMGQVYYVYDLDNQTLTRTQQPNIAGHIVNASASAASLGTLQLVYVKNVNLPSQASTDPDVFAVTFFPAPDSWSAVYALPPTSPDGRKVAMYTYGSDNELYKLYDTATLALLGTVSNAQAYGAPVLRFTDSGDELFVVDASQGRFDIYGAVPNDTSLKYADTFAPYRNFAGVFQITPDQGALILYGATHDSGSGSLPAIKIVPISR